MIFSKKDNISVLTQEKASIPELVNEISKSYDDICRDNIIVNLATLDEVSTSDVLEFLQISNEHRDSNHSFVVVTNSIDLEEIPDEIIVVPTLQEAFDMIEMEEIERDLGF
ncbi:MAG: ribonuclease Z [Flavobacteriaceae bacterium]|nr:ribonuclease Z [Bacteroidia bacterium]NNL15063.1 ribonuclease Z [Flavobacteriaceae bacterium]